MRRRWRAALRCALLVHVAAAAAAPLPEPALRLSTSIEPASLRAPPPSGERDLLRLEWQAARSREAEADALGDILLRLRHMGDTVADIQRLIEARPAAKAPAPPLATPDDSSFALPAWASPFGVLFAAASGLLLLAWLRVRRRPEARRQASDAGTVPERPVPAPPPAPPPTLQPATAPPPSTVAKAATPAIEPPPAPMVDFILEPLDEAAPQPPTGDHAEATPAPASAQLEVATPPASAAESIETPPVPASEPPATIDFEMSINLDDAAAAPTPGQGADPAIELADIMLSMGLAHGAAETLSEQIRKHPKQALYQWLKLLDIYRSSGMQKDFERAAQDMRQYFNVQAKAWDEEEAGGPSLEDYPRLAEKLLALWPGEECAAFLAELLLDNRGGARNGFPQSVAEEILFLQQVRADVAAGVDFTLD